MSKPLVSVIIPTYNYAHYISKAIDSILSQNYPADCIEIIVYDDGSKDNTRAVVQDYVEKAGVKYFFQQNKGKACATYKAILESKGKYVFNLDADDYFFPEKIAATVAIFEGDADIVHVASPARIVRDFEELDDFEQIPEEITEKAIDGNYLSMYFLKKHMLYGGGSTYAARASALKKIVIPDSVDMYIDEFLILAIFPYGKSYFIKEPLSVWRSHSFNYSGNAVNKEDKARKGKRLLASSTGVLEYLENNNFDKYLIKIYRLQDLTRRISFKEDQGTKGIGDIVKFATDVFIKLRPGWRLIKNYYVINRLVPTAVLNGIKAKSRPKPMNQTAELSSQAQGSGL